MPTLITKRIPKIQSRPFDNLRILIHYDEKAKRAWSYEINTMHGRKIAEGENCKTKLSAIESIARFFESRLAAKFV